MNTLKKTFLALSILAMPANGILAWPGQETASKAWNWLKGTSTKARVKAGSVSGVATGIAAAALLYKLNPKVKEAVNSNASKAKTFSTENLTKLKNKYNSFGRNTKIGLGLGLGAVAVGSAVVGGCFLLKKVAPNYGGL